MNVTTIGAPRGAHRFRKRLGRGPGSGRGKTSGRGIKGAMARSGARRRPGFEGGQMPLIRRVPKRGFVHAERTLYAVVNVSDLNRFRAGGRVGPAELIEAGLVNRSRPVKVLGDGALTKALQVAANAFSASAKEKIAKAGGSIEELTTTAAAP